MKNWKACERRIAAELGGVRIPVSGRSRGDNPDVAHPTFAIEVKSRKKLPGWIHNAMRQAEASSNGGDQLPVAILHEDRARYSEALAVVRLSDLAKLFGDQESECK